MLNPNSLVDNTCKAVLQVRPVAQVAELVDALASGASDRMVVEVRVFSWAPAFATMARASPAMAGFALAHVGTGKRL